MADIKELIPEFFYLPEFLVNRNNFDLGQKQSGELLCDIVLPPWSKGDPQEFVRLHREVSQGFCTALAAVLVGRLAQTVWCVISVGSGYACRHDYKAFLTEVRMLLYLV